MQTALIVDDEPCLRGWLDHFFRERGYRTTLCSGVSEAVTALSTTCFDIVLTDYNMADGTGGTVLVAAKTHCAGAVRALMTGALSLVPDAHKEVAHHFFEKPLQLGPLHDLLESVGGTTSSAPTEGVATAQA